MSPPSGTPIKLGEILYGLGNVLSQKSTIERFRAAVCSYFDVKHCFLVSSGRAALTLILRSLSKVSDKKEVIIPAYTCFSVPSAIAKLGLKIRLCDISLETLDFDYAELAKIGCGNVLCIVPTHLLGLPCEMDKIIEFGKAKGVYVIDDAAQAVGATFNGRLLGTFGDVGFFSLGRGKNITTMGGGVIVTNSDELATEIGKELGELRKSGIFNELEIFAKLLAYSLFLHPCIYWLPDKLPFLELGISKFDPDFGIETFGELQACIGALLLKRLDFLNEIRIENAGYIVKGVGNIENIVIPRPVENSYPVYLRLPIIVRDTLLRERIFGNLLRAGIGVSKMYPTALNEIPGIDKYMVLQGSSYPKAQELARSILTLPTHPYVTHDDLDLTIATIEKNCLSKA